MKFKITCLLLYLTALPLFVFAKDDKEDIPPVQGRLIIELYEDDLCDVRAGNTHSLLVHSTGGGMLIELVII